MVKIITFLIIFLPLLTAAREYPSLEKSFYPNGTIKEETQFTSPTQYQIKQYSELGFLTSQESFFNSKRHGKAYYFSDEGKPTHVVVYEGGSIKQKIEYKELYAKADSFLENSTGNPLRAQNVQRKLWPIWQWIILRKLEVGVGALVFLFLYFLFIFHKPDHKAYFKYAKAQTAFSVEGELLSSPPRKIVFPLNFYLQIILFLVTIAFTIHASKFHPNILMLTMGVLSLGLYLISKTYRKAKILKYGDVVSAEILGIEYVRKFNGAKIILHLKYELNSHSYDYKCSLPMPKTPYSVGDKVSLLIFEKQFIVYSFSNYKVKKSA